MRKLNHLLKNLTLYFFTFLLFLPFFTTAQNNGRVVQKVIDAKASQRNFEGHQIFSNTTLSARNSYSDAVSDGVVFDFDATKVSALRRANPRYVSLEIPFNNNGGQVILELVRVKIYDDDISFC
jgi:hypothetical protein